MDVEEPQATRHDMAPDGVLAWVPLWALVRW
jgi:hypothetical protein